MPLQAVREVAEEAAGDSNELRAGRIAYNFSMTMQHVLFALADVLQLWTADSGGQQQLLSGVTQLQVVLETLLLPSVLAYWPSSSLLHDRLFPLLSQHVPAAVQQNDVASSSAADTAAAWPGTLDATGPAQSPSSSSNNAQDSTHGSTSAAMPQLPSTTARLLSPQAFLMPVLQEFERTVRTVARSAPLAANASLLQNALRSMAMLCHGIMDLRGGLNDLRGGLLVDWAWCSSCAELQQLCSLLVSMLKFGSKHMGWDVTTANELRLAAAMGACSIFVRASSIDDEHNSSSSRGAPAPVPGDAFDSSLHSLHTFGRCCLHWAQQLQAEIPLLLHQRVAMLQGRPAERGGSMSLFNSACFDAADICLEPLIETVSGDRSLLEILLSDVQEGLESAAFSPPGVSKQQLLSALGQLQGALPAASDPSTANPVPLVGLVRQLHWTGLAFSAIAAPHMCNYPACSTVRGSTELDLVAGKSCVCGGCRTARYCCADCQRQHWVQHRPVCKAIEAAATADADQGDSTGGRLHGVG